MALLLFLSFSLWYLLFDVVLFFVFIGLMVHYISVFLVSFHNIFAKYENSYVVRKKRTMFILHLLYACLVILIDLSTTCIFLFKISWGFSLKNISGMPSECQTVWIQGLIWAQCLQRL